MGLRNMNIAVALPATSCCPEIKGSALLPAVSFLYCACKYVYLGITTMEFVSIEDTKA